MRFTIHISNKTGLDAAQLCQALKEAAEGVEMSPFIAADGLSFHCSGTCPDEQINTVKDAAQALGVQVLAPAA